MNRPTEPRLSKGLSGAGILLMLLLIGVPLASAVGATIEAGVIIENTGASGTGDDRMTVAVPLIINSLTFDGQNAPVLDGVTIDIEDTGQALPHTLEAFDRDLIMITMRAGGASSFRTAGLPQGWSLFQPTTSVMENGAGSVALASGVNLVELRRAAILS